MPRTVVVVGDVTDAGEGAVPEAQEGVGPSSDSSSSDSSSSESSSSASSSPESSPSDSSSSSVSSSDDEPERVEEAEEDYLHASSPEVTEPPSLESVVAAIRYLRPLHQDLLTIMFVDRPASDHLSEEEVDRVLPIINALDDCPNLSYEALRHERVSRVVFRLQEDHHPDVVVGPATDLFQKWKLILQTTPDAFHNLAKARFEEVKLAAAEQAAQDHEPVEYPEDADEDSNDEEEPEEPAQGHELVEDPPDGREDSEDEEEGGRERLLLDPPSNRDISSVCRHIRYDSDGAEHSVHDEEVEQGNEMSKSPDTIVTIGDSSTDDEELIPSNKSGRTTRRVIHATSSESSSEESDYSSSDEETEPTSNSKCAKFKDSSRDEESDSSSDEESDSSSVEEKKRPKKRSRKKSPPRKSSDSSQDSQWTCPRCTTLCGKDAPVCGVCQIPRPLRDNEWNCPRCTCLCSASQNSCSACGHRRPSRRTAAVTNRTVETVQDALDDEPLLYDEDNSSVRAATSPPPRSARASPANKSKSNSSGCLPLSSPGTPSSGTSPIRMKKSCDRCRRLHRRCDKPDGWEAGSWCKICIEDKAHGSKIEDCTYSRSVQGRRSDLLPSPQVEVEGVHRDSRIEAASPVPSTASSGGVENNDRVQHGESFSTSPVDSLCRGEQGEGPVSSFSQSLHIGGKDDDCDSRQVVNIVLLYALFQRPKSFGATSSLALIGEVMTLYQDPRLSPVVLQLMA